MPTKASEICLLAARLDVTSNSVDISQNTGSLIVPKGTTAQRPGTPATGMVRYNTSLGIGEIYNGSSWQYFGNQTGKLTFVYTGAEQSFTVPTGATQARIKMWGAAGGSSGGSGSTRTATGGTGGYVEGTFSLIGITTLKIVVGQGGGYNASSYSFTAGDGGGYSGIFNGSVSFNNAIAIAGGGGGAASGSGSGYGVGGGGGGLTGLDGQDDTRLGTNTGGFGGSQSAGGARGVDSYGAAQNLPGSQLAGGRGAGATNSGETTQGVLVWNSSIYGGGGLGGASNVGNWVGGGGGAGYYGGGGGNQGYAGGGGGGSSYIGGLTIVNYNLQGSMGVNSGSVSAVRNSDSDYQAGVSAVTTQSPGGNGLVVLEYF